MLAFLIPLDATDPQETYERLRQEIALYSEALAAKAHVVVLTKLDLLGPGDGLPRIAAPEAAGTLAISSAAGTGVEELKEYLWKFVETAKAGETEQPAEEGHEEWDLEEEER